MDKQTVLRNVSLLPDGTVEAYFELIAEDGKRLHCIVCEPGCDLAERLEALNRSLVDDLKFPAVDSWPEVEAAASAVTQEMVDAYRVTQRRTYPL